MKVLKFRDGADVFVVPESAVESIGSFSPTGATLTLKSGQEVVVDRNAGVDVVEVDSIEEMVRIVVKNRSMCPLTGDTKCGRLPRRKGSLCERSMRSKSGTGSTGLSSKKTSGSAPSDPSRPSGGGCSGADAPAARPSLSPDPSCGREERDPAAAGTTTERGC